MNRALDEAWRALGLPASSLARVSIQGGEALPSAFEVTTLAVGSVAAAALAISELIATTGPTPPVVVDRRLAALWFDRSIEPIGWTLPDPRDAITNDYRTTDGWIRLHANAPLHRAAAVRALACADRADAVAQAVAAWQADPLEAAVLAAGGCAAAMRTLDAWDAHPQGAAVATEPLIGMTRVPTVGPRRRPLDPHRPLAGLRVLDLTRVLAGPIATRFLGGYGADVLRIDPPHWDEPRLAPEVTLGKHCARLDLRDDDDRTVFERLLREADVLVHGCRPGALDALGYDPVRRRAIKPDLIDVSLDAYGWTGPWQGRRGFDSLVQMSSGIAAAGMAWKKDERPTPLPVQALDHATGYLAAAAVVAGVIARRTAGHATTARLSLARTARLLVDLGPQEIGAPVWSARGETDLAEAVEPTPWGPARRVAPPARVDGAPMRWDRGASPLGSAEARWAADR